ncbi:luciferase-like domain-containing protein [Aspergillus undulatus]|uniref:luciferase-like domain-containing protein n=1 Tax=Aspergillus undulatus TaxID=1810928 RepID=UPI003CCD3507
MPTRKQCLLSPSRTRVAASPEQFRVAQVTVGDPKQIPECVADNPPSSPITGTTACQDTSPNPGACERAAVIRPRSRKSRYPSPSTRNGNKKQIILNAFENDPEDRSATKRTLAYWIHIAQVLERDIAALCLADTYGGHGTYEGSIDNCIRRAAQWRMTDSLIVTYSAMASVTKNLAIAITASTSFEPPFVLAKRLSTLDHLTNGRIGWNIVTGWKKGAFKAIGLDEPPDHDHWYAQADKYVLVLYKLWEGSWADDAIVQDAANDIPTDPAKSKHIVDPSPQRTPFLFHHTAGSQFGATHAEGIYVFAHSPSFPKPRVSKIREMAQKAGRDPQSIKFFASINPFIGRTEEEAQAKYERAKKYASAMGGLVLFSGWTGIDLSQIPLDEGIDPVKHSLEPNKVTSDAEVLTARTPDLPKLTPAQVADVLEKWVDDADVDGFNVAYVTTPGTFEDVVYLLVPELRRKGVYAAKSEEAVWGG